MRFLKLLVVLNLFFASVNASSAILVVPTCEGTAKAADEPCVLMDKKRQACDDYTDGNAAIGPITNDDSSENRAVAKQALIIVSSCSSNPKIPADIKLDDYKKSCVQAAKQCALICNAEILNQKRLILQLSTESNNAASLTTAQTDLDGAQGKYDDCVGYIPLVKKAEQTAQQAAIKWDEILPQLIALGLSIKDLFDTKAQVAALPSTGERKPTPGFTSIPGAGGTTVTTGGGGTFSGGQKPLLSLNGAPTFDGLGKPTGSGSAALANQPGGSGGGGAGGALGGGGRGGGRDSYGLGGGGTGGAPTPTNVLSESNGNPSSRGGGGYFGGGAGGKNGSSEWRPAVANNGGGGSIAGGPGRLPTSARSTNGLPLDISSRFGASNFDKMSMQYQKQVQQGSLVP